MSLKPLDYEVGLSRLKTYFLIELLALKEMFILIEIELRVYFFFNWLRYFIKHFVKISIRVMLQVFLDIDIRRNTALNRDHPPLVLTHAYSLRLCGSSEVKDLHKLVGKPLKLIQIFHDRALFSFARVSLRLLNEIPVAPGVSDDWLVGLSGGELRLDGH